LTKQLAKSLSKSLSIRERLEKVDLSQRRRL